MSEAILIQNLTSRILTSVKGICDDARSLLILHQYVPSFINAGHGRGGIRAYPGNTGHASPSPCAMTLFIQNEQMGYLSDAKDSLYHSQTTNLNPNEAIAVCDCSSKKAKLAMLSG